MADPFVAEIRMFPFNFAPKGWAFCDGQYMSISQNTALFALLGTTYGGNGMSTFALPDLQDCVPMHPGHGNGLSWRDLGDRGGEETHSLLWSEIPAHTHTLKASNQPANTRMPANAPVLARSVGQYAYTPPATLMSLAPAAVTTAGQSQPHNNMQPYLTVNFCIALQGVYPPRP